LWTILSKEIVSIEFWLDVGRSIEYWDMCPSIYDVMETEAIQTERERAIVRGRLFEWQREKVRERERVRELEREMEMEREKEREWERKREMAREREKEREKGKASDLPTDTQQSHEWACNSIDTTTLSSSWYIKYRIITHGPGSCDY
jgi:hypothetical protein